MWWTLWTYQANQLLAEEIQKVRTRGEPLTTIELNEYYQASKGRPDMTAEILAALAICSSPDLKPEWERLPIVGNPQDFGFPEEVPPASETWGQLTEVEGYLAKQQSALDTFQEIARQRGTARYPSDYSAGLKTPLEHLQGLRQAARVLSLEFHVHLHRGRTSKAVDSILAQLALAQTLDGDPTRVSQLVRVALGKLAIDEIQRGTKEATFSDADLARLQMGLRDFQFELGLKQAFIGDRASAYTACLDPLKMAAEKSNPTPEEIREIASRPPQRVVDAAKILEVYRRLIESTDDPLAESVRKGREVEAELDAMVKAPIGKFAHIMTLLLVAGISYSAQAFADTAARRDAADVALAAELYRRRHGKWPDKMDQLVPEFLPTVPVDPFDGKPMRMTVSAEGFKAYSIGRDDTDDGGKLSDQVTPGNDAGFMIQVPQKP